MITQIAGNNTVMDEQCSLTVVYIYNVESIFYSAGIDSQ